MEGNITSSTTESENLETTALPTSPLISSTVLPTSASSTIVSTSHTDPPITEDDKSLVYILVPIFSLIFVVTLTIGVFLLLQRKRRLDILRHQLVPFYNFAPGDEEDWETELVENETNTNHPRRDYKTITT